MELKPIAPLAQWARVARSILIVALLLGSLFPVIQSINIALIAAILCAAVILYELFRWAPKLHPIVLVPLFFGAIALHALHTVPTSAYGDDKLQKWLTITMISALAACLLRDRRTFQTFGAVWLVAVSILAGVTILGYDGGRADAFGANPIWLARALATGVIIAIWLWWKKYASAWLMLLVVAILGAGLVASGSRGPVLGVVAGVVVLAVFAGRGRAWRIVLIIAGGIAAVWAVQVLPFFAGSRFETILAGAGAADDAVRNTYWDLSFDVIQRYPEGVGFGNWGAAAGNPRHLWPHNLFLEVFSETGMLLGFLTLAVVAAVVIRLLIRAPKDPIALLVLAALATELVGVNVSGDLNARTFWFLIATGMLVTTPFIVDTPMKLKLWLRRKQRAQDAQDMKDAALLNAV